MKVLKPLLALGVLLFAVAMYFVFRGTPGEEKQAAGQFVSKIEPEVERQVSKEILTKPAAIAWDPDVITGRDESAAPVGMITGAFRTNFRMVGQGRLDGGGSILADAAYARSEGRFTSLRIVVTFPSRQIKTMTNVPLTESYLLSNGIRPDLVKEIMKALAAEQKTSPGSATYEATLTLGAKWYEATTAVFTGSSGTALTLTCYYALPK